MWGVVEDRLIELCVEPATDGRGFALEGLPVGRTRSTGDRVRAALINSGLLREVPPVALRLEPPVGGGATSSLDLAVALAVLASTGAIGAGLRWILATGRLGLDGTVHSPDLEEVTPLVRIVTALGGGAG